MARIGPFEKYTDKYEKWFDENKYAYASELLAVKRLLSSIGKGVEIGVGTGRFAAPLGIKYGLDPSKSMSVIAEERGIEVTLGVAENLPYNDFQFDFVLMITPICFLDDIETAFREVYRILKSKGQFIIGFVDKESTIGKYYFNNKNSSVFYKQAQFYTLNKVVSCLKKNRFTSFVFKQTLFDKLKNINQIEPVKDGYGEGSFVVIKAEKQYRRGEI